MLTLVPINTVLFRPGLSVLGFNRHLTIIGRCHEEHESEYIKGIHIFESEADKFTEFLVSPVLR